MMTLTAKWELRFRVAAMLRREAYSIWKSNGAGDLRPSKTVAELYFAANAMSEEAIATMPRPLTR